MAETKPINLYMKLAKMRVELQDKKLAKTGHNTHSNYEYYEMSDFLPACNEIAKNNNTIFLYEPHKEDATLTLINCENTDEQIVFTIPLTNVSVPGASSMQNVGAVTTYSRRYLYMIAFEISENDDLDNTKASEARAKKEEEEKKAAEYQAKQAELAKRPIGQAKINTINAELARTGVDISSFCKRFKVERVEDITEGLFGVAMRALKATPTQEGFEE